VVWLTEPAPAKVNLTLHVTGRAPDGYHWLDSLVVFGPAADILHASPATGLSLVLQGPFADGLLAEADNLVLRAARALAAWAGRAPDAALVLEKHLPVASGIGGGSADAAAALRVLARLWAVDVPPGEMAAIAAGLGADVPVCLAGRPTRMAGIGEKLSAAPGLPPCGMLLVNPGVALATADVFRARAGAFSAAADFPESWPDAASMARDLAGLRNDLEAPALAVCLPVGAVLAALRALPGCLLARMSGSGATCFGLFADPAAAELAAGALPPGWWRCAGAMGT
jgi:4-diphosphocytidyl-2-C-methyl-D-erythritol kinase